VPRFLAVWLGRDAPQDSALAPAVLARLIHDHQTRQLTAVARMPLPQLLRFLDVIPFCAGLPYDEEIRLARVLQAHEDEPSARGPPPACTNTNASPRRARGRRRAAGRAAWRTVLRLGLCVQLETLADPSPSPETCQALLASQDPPQRTSSRS